MLSKLLKLVSVLVGFAAALVGIFLYTEIPKKCGLFTWWAVRDPSLIGLTPAFLYGQDWNYDFEQLFAKENDLRGQRAIVTEASAGIGYAMASVLSHLGADVVMACRNPKKCERRADEIRNEQPLGKLTTMTIDTSSLKSVRAFANEFRTAYGDGKEDGGSLEMLFLNAGTAYNPNKTHPCVPLSEEDNIEYVFQTNYVGHHLLYRLLETNLFNARIKPATVVQTSSGASFESYSYKVATDLATLNGCNESVVGRGGLNLSYGQSKLAQVLWAKELTKRLAARGQQRDIIANAFHPGFVATEMLDKVENTPPLLKKFLRYVIDMGATWNITEGALTGLYLGIEKEQLLRDKAMGKYFHPQVIEVDNPLANDDALQKALWDFSDALVKDYL